MSVQIERGEKSREAQAIELELKRQKIEGILQEHGGFMRGVAIRIARSETGGEDLLFTTLGNLYLRDMTRYPQNPDEQKRYLAAALSRTQLDALRANDRHPTIPWDSYIGRASGTPPVDDQALANLGIGIVLKEAQKNNFEGIRARSALLHGIGYLYEEIARKQDVPLGTVQSGISRFRKANKPK